MTTKSNRRSFLKNATLMAGGAFSAQSIFNQAYGAIFQDLSAKYNAFSPSEMADQEDYWATIQQAYSASSAPVLNLNNGGVSPSPLPVLQAVERYSQLSNQGPSYYMWRILDQGREPLREKLALLGGADPEEIAINRNATEALNTIIYGLDFIPVSDSYSRNSLPKLGLREGFPTCLHPPLGFG